MGRGPVPLTRLEFLVLRKLMAHAGRSVSKGRLLTSVPGYGFEPGVQHRRRVRPAAADQARRPRHPEGAR